MNFKRNCVIITALLASVFMVASCSNNKTYKHYEYFSAKEDKHEDESFNDGKYVKYGNYANYVGYGDKNMGDAINVMRNFGDRKLLNGVGDEKILVIPVEFKDFGCKDLGISENEYVANLKKGFTGANENNTFVSVAEYFNRSSYGKLKLDAKVVDKFYTFPKSVAEIKTGITREIVATYYSEIIKWYESNYSDINDYVIKGLESTKDPSEAKNVPIFLAYTYPVSLTTVNSDFFWAFTFESIPLTWASYSFLYTDNGEPDAHTYIHEVGHLLGLNDYYPTKESSSSTVPEPTARIDMMDCSVGDETALSKMYLNWTRPYHVKDETEIKIKPFEGSGDLIILNDNWNKSVFDEYFVVEFYSPTGLNAYDVNVGNSQAKLPTLPGIKIYHVDARLGYFNIRTKEFDCYCSEALPSTINETVGFAHDNNTYSKQTTINQGNYLYELVLNNTTEKISGCAQNSHLFRAGSEISALTRSNGTVLNYKISITSLNFKEATIKITKTK